MNVGNPEHVVSADFGLRFSPGQEGRSISMMSGVFGDAPSLERYFGEATSIHAGITLRPRVKPVDLFFRVAPFVLLHERGDSRWFSHYAVGALHQFNFVTFGAGINGLWVQPQGSPYGNLDSIHHVQLEVVAKLGRLRPGIVYQVPLESEIGSVRFTMGLSLGVAL